MQVLGWILVALVALVVVVGLGALVASAPDIRRYRLIQRM